MWPPYSYARPGPGDGRGATLNLVRARPRGAAPTPRGGICARLMLAGMTLTSRTLP